MTMREEQLEEGPSLEDLMQVESEKYDEQQAVFKQRFHSAAFTQTFQSIVVHVATAATHTSSAKAQVQGFSYNKVYIEEATVSGDTYKDRLLELVDHIERKVKDAGFDPTCGKVVKMSEGIF